MAETVPDSRAPVLALEDVHVHYGHAHVLQGVSLRLDRGVLAVVGRNGMGKTTCCNAIIGLVRASGGRILFGGRDITGLAPNAIVNLGIGYVPQGRRIWRSLTVDEHLRLARRGRKAVWTVERIYQTFPRLAERRHHGGSQLSGGEQQMLAIARALLSNPRLLVMDEPTEGLAPIIVEQVVIMLKRLAAEGEISVLLVEQNLGVATDVADDIAVMVNGSIARTMPARALARDSDLQQRLLGVRRADEEEEIPPEIPMEVTRFYRVQRADADAAPISPAIAPPQGAAPTRWGRLSTAIAAPPATGDARPDEASPTVADFATPRLAEMVDGVAYVAGTFDTKGRELNFLKTCLDRVGVRTLTVDLSTSGRPSPATIGPAEVARHHPLGAGAVFTGDRGTAVSAMADAFERFIVTRRDVGGLVAAGGSGATALVTPGMRRLPIGLPKVMVSTVASGDVRRYVGPSDICMIHSVTDVSGINRISRRVLSNAAHALAGMMRHQMRETGADKPAIGLTMFGVTTPCVQAVARALDADYDCLIFHATGIGGQSMEKLLDSHLLSALIDVTTTEVADHLVGGVLSAGEDRLGAVIRTRLPYVGSCGALDMVNFGPMDTVPERFRGRTLYRHNPQVTLMRTTPEECTAIGRWIVEKLNRCEGPVRFLIPQGGVSMIDAPGRPFHDPEADRALFQAIEQNWREAPNRKLLRLPHNVNDPAFVEALVANFNEIMAPRLLAAAE